MLKKLSSLAVAFAISILIFISTGAAQAKSLLPSDGCAAMLERLYKDTYTKLSRNFPDHFDEAYISLLEECREGVVIEKPSNRLSVIAKNKKIDEFRKHKRIVDSDDPKTQGLPSIDQADTALSPYDRVFGKRLSEKLKPLLSPDEAEILFRSASGETQKEIAKSLGTSEDAVQKRMTRAYPKVAPVLESARLEYRAEKSTSASHDSGSWFHTFAVIVGMALAAVALVFGLSCFGEAAHAFSTPAAAAPQPARSRTAPAQPKRAVATRQAVARR